MSRRLSVSLRKLCLGCGVRNVGDFPRDETVCGKPVQRTLRKAFSLYRLQKIKEMPGGSKFLPSGFTGKVQESNHEAEMPSCNSNDYRSKWMPFQ